MNGHVLGLDAAKASAMPGLCIFCDEPVLRGRKLLCGSQECSREYLRAWHRDARVRHPERYGPAFYAAKRAAGGAR